MPANIRRVQHIGNDMAPAIVFFGDGDSLWLPGWDTVHAEQGVDLAICLKWWKYMGDLMPSNPDHSPVTAPLREVFHLP